MSGPERTVMFQLPSMLSGTLACVAGTMAGRSWELTAGTFVIGRNDTCDLPLTAEPGVSKVHCKIVAEGEHYLLADCESRNGTIVNGVPVQRVRLRDGDEVRICGCVLRFAQRGGDTQVRVRNADAPLPSGEPEASQPEALADGRPPEPPMLLPSDALASIEAAPEPVPTQPNAPRRSRARTLFAWYASGLAGSLLFGGTASAVIFAGEGAEKVALVDEKAAEHPGDKAAEHPSDKPTGGPADKPADVPAVEAKAPDAEGAQPEVPALDPAAIKSVADADQPPPDKAAAEPAASDAPGAPGGDAKPEADKAAAAAAKGEAPAADPAPARDEERARRRARREEAPAEEPTADAPEGEAKLFAATVEGGKSETLKTRGGKVKSVEAADGDVVERGKVLVTFDAGGNEDEVSTLKERIASLEGIDDDDARRQLREARQRLDALQAASKSVPLVAGMSGKLAGFSVTVGDVLKANQLVGRISEAGVAKKVRVTVDRGTRVKRGASATLLLRGGGEASGTVSSTSGRTIIIDTGDTAADTVESVRF